MFLSGSALVTVVVTFAIDNPDLIPALVLSGSFLVPATFVLRAFGRLHSGVATAKLLFGVLVAGVVLGVPAQYRQDGPSQLTGGQIDVLTALSWGGLALLSLVGVLWLMGTPQTGHPRKRSGSYPPRW